MPDEVWCVEFLSSLDFITLTISETEMTICISGISTFYALLSKKRRSHEKRENREYHLLPSENW
ncbi:hypothetical protein GCM10011339_42270 [Echinicola rosea]|uniref:Uncharacterized protein n=1 Tax=Echinicola rosea TaxID=1807691 RepID=A0ABQ1VAI7_9BACT|nr:hypothetical protein GCM10011339_42270 [Echinicola rosea]